MKPEVQIRCADSSDAELLAELGARTFTETFAAENTPEDMNAYLAEVFTAARLAEELADPKAVFLLAFVEGEAAGYAKLYQGEPPTCVTGESHMELSRLYVLQQWLGGGVGRALMQRCVDEARQSGARVMWLGVWEKNLRAQAFYRKWGFTTVGEQGFQLGADAQTDWVMQRTL
ncbi:MAG TPA: GNAT family N-acetyltransferase [Pyrinomonadaceae bacterium]|nr:GNAT family N-acetyltransferase [Pyrinomonadaceae bacterium]